MQLLTLGLNHTTATVDVREQAAFAPEYLNDALKRLSAQGVVQEAAILSTCNRTELYCRPRCDTPEPIVEWLCNFKQLDVSDLRPNLYEHPDEKAVQHTFRVAAGLDSMVLGESQILGQMKEAFSSAQAAGTTGKVLNRLFQQSFSVAKQVRTDTAIGANAVSVAYAAVSLAKRLFADFGNKTVLLIGAGETIELVARHFVEVGVTKIIVANRNIERAQKLASEWNCEGVSLADIPRRLPEADIIVTATASTLPILGKGLVESALKIRKHKPQFIVDLAVPRDVEPEVATLADAYLYSVDDLQQIIEDNIAARRDAAVQAEEIIDLQVVRFMRWLRSLDSIPTVRNFRDNVNELRDAELKRAIKRLQSGADAEQVLQQLANTLTNKFTHAPSQALKDAEIQGDRSILSAARKLFNLKH